MIYVGAFFLHTMRGEHRNNPAVGITVSIFIIRRLIPRSMPKVCKLKHHNICSCKFSKPYTAQTNELLKFFSYHQKNYLSRETVFLWAGHLLSEFLSKSSSLNLKSSVFWVPVLLLYLIKIWMILLRVIEMYTFVQNLHEPVNPSHSSPRW